jgi:hypothetical protein
MQSLFGFLPVGVVGVLAYASMLYFIDRSISALQTRQIFRIAASVLTVGVSLYAFFRLGGATTNKLDVNQIAVLVGGGANILGLFYFVDDAVPNGGKPWVRYAAALTISGIFFYALQEYVPNHARCVEITKAAISLVAAVFVFFEAHRKGQGKPVAERWKRLVGVTLGIAAISAYFNGYNFGYPKYYHRWDQYHYYMGAKYFPELGYKNLYKCAVVAQAEIGKVTHHLDRPFNSQVWPTQVVDMGEEMKDPDKKIRDLPGENSLVPVGPILDARAECRDRFSDVRWEEYKADVAFYRIVSGKGYWTDMQKDHGFNPPPVWTIAGKFFSDIAPASVRYLQFLASLDIVYLGGMFVALWWAFGWRVFSVGAIFWGCQSSAPFYWTGGAFLRQDWLFWLVLSVCCIRKGHFKIAGASVVYAALLRVFPGLIVVGTLVPAIVYAIKHRRMHRDHLQMLIGGFAAAVVLIAVSIVYTNQENAPFYQPYKLFYQHTIETHDKTPLTNHMGLQVIVAHKFLEFQAPGLRNAEDAAKAAGEKASPLKKALARVKFPITLATGKPSGQMEFVRDNNKLDPFEDWKRLRNERYKKYKPVAYAIILGTLIFFVLVTRKIKNLWVTTCLGQIFIILGSQLTCYYYSFMILGAPLLKMRKQVELGLFALAAVTQIIWMNSYWNDNKYTLLTIASLVFCYVMIGFFYRRAPEHEAKEPARRPARA